MTITSISPSSGPVAGGTSVTITGSGFRNPLSVFFGTVAATGPILDSGTQVRVVAPAGSGTGTVDVTVIARGVTSATSAADQFTYFAVPTVSSVSPNTGSTAGGTSVTITGTGFTGATAVKIGGNDATSYTVDSPTQITAVTPAGNGNAQVTVTTPGGTSTTSFSTLFFYSAPPTVTSISPTSGPTSGGTSVVITGTNLASTTAVSFGATAATSFTVNSATQVTAVAPPGSLGTVDVRVTAAGGPSATSPADQFTYVAPVPTVTSLSPASGPTAGGTSVTITGTGFTGSVIYVRFGVRNALSYTVNSDTSITAVSPAGTGTVDVRVTTTGGVSAISAADQFTYTAAPAVTSISPNSGPAAGGTSVTITGTGFTGATAVAFGATAATSFTVNSATSITAIAPAGTGGQSVNVSVTTPSGTSPGVVASLFTYPPPPAVNTLSPPSGPAAGGTSVIITGTGFTGATAVAFGATAATSYTVNSATSITAVAPAGTGVVDVTVTTGLGTSATSAAARFTYNAPAPTVTSLSPTSGPTVGGTSVTLTGTGFTGATAVAFGATAATSFTVNSATSITAIAPAGTGTVDVRVTTAGGTSATSAADQFTYTSSPAPTVTSISPTSGPAAGGTSVILTGTGFTGATAVTFGATAATSFTVNSATSITAIAPAGTGTVDVRVTTAGGTSATSAADQFTYTSSPAPTVTSISPTSGPAAGGTSVIISGLNFTGTTSVKFGTASATGFTVNSATSITAISPPGTGVVDVTVTANAQTSATSAADRFTYVVVSTTTTTLASSQNPSAAGQTVTLTATVTAASGTPTGTVTFSDNGTAIGTATLAGGTATFATAALSGGTHAITATYAGDGAYQTSTSTALMQTVSIPADSAKLRSLQVNVSKMVAQQSGQAITGAVDAAIGEGFSDGGQFMTPSGTGMRFNFSADEQASADSETQTANAYAGGLGGRQASPAMTRVDNAFAALDRPVTKAPPMKVREPREWIYWADVRGSGVDRWSSAPVNVGMPAGEANLVGSQLNLTTGVTYRPTDRFLIGVLGGYETFSYTQQDINGRLKGDGWTIGSYAGWRITPTLRWDAALAYSGIGYDGTAGTATGSFSGNRWLASTGVTGTYDLNGGLLVEPSMKVYALWEHQNAYTDSLATLQNARDFATGRASGGVKFAYSVGWWNSVQLLPFAGAYGDYYFTRDNAAVVALAGAAPLASVPLLDGWSARVTGGIGARLNNGVMFTVGGELGGLGSNTQTWTLSGRTRIPFAAR